jgi:hypothetical protein
MQLALYDEAGKRGRPRKAGGASEPRGANAQERQQRAPVLMCAACRAREARYGFRDRDDDDPMVERPKTLCFDCFRMEMDRRRAVAEQLARGWNATQSELPLAGKLEEASRRRRRAQIAARRALGVR